MEYLKGLLSTVLYLTEERWQNFPWRCLRMLTTPLRQLTGNRIRWSDVYRDAVYVGFLGLRNASHFKIVEQIMLLSGMS